MFKHRSLFMFTALVSALFLMVAPLNALIPPQYTDNESYQAKGPVQRIVVKTFEAVDKFDRVELGNMVEHPIIVDFYNNGHISRITELNQKGDLLFYYVSEEKDGLATTQKRYSSKESMDAYSTFEYKDKRLQSESVYNAEGVSLYNEVYSYNKSGQLLSVIRRNTKGEKLQTLDYAYDNAGNCTMERMRSKEDRFVYQKSMSYDGRRMMGEKYHNQEGLMTNKIDYTYDAQGAISVVRSGSPGGAVNTTRVTYEYDAQKNWIRCTVYAGEYVPTRIITRKIEYK